MLILHGINTYKHVWACCSTFPIHRRRKNINKFHCKQRSYFIQNSYPTNRNDHKTSFIEEKNNYFLQNPYLQSNTNAYRHLNVHFIQIILACSFKSSRSYFSFSTQILIQKIKGILVDSRFAGERSNRYPKFKKLKLYVVAKPFISNLWFVCSSSAVTFSS